MCPIRQDNSGSERPVSDTSLDITLNQHKIWGGGKKKRKTLAVCFPPSCEGCLF